MKKLSFEAQGLLAYIQSMEPEQQQFTEQELIDGSDVDSAETTLVAIAELLANGNLTQQGGVYILNVSEQ